MKMVVRAHKKARIEMIPLIDVIFFCLATFVLVTLAMNKNRAITVNLQEGKGARPEKAIEAVTITVTERGELFWDRDLMSWDTFVTRVGEYGRLTVEPRVLFNADVNVQFSQVANVMDQVRKANIGEIGILMRPESKARGGQ